MKSRLEGGMEKAYGKDLDNLCRVLGVHRRKLWFFKEPDFLLRKRALKALRTFNRAYTAE